MTCVDKEICRSENFLKRTVRIYIGDEAWTLLSWLAFTLSMHESSGEFYLCVILACKLKLIHQKDSFLLSWYIFWVALCHVIISPRIFASCSYLNTGRSDLVRYERYRDISLAGM